MNLGNIGRHTLAAPIAALTLVAGGSIALAASGGAGPAPQAAEHRPTASPSATPTHKPTADPKPDRTTEPGSDASPSPSLAGLCKAYQAGGYASSTKNGNTNPAWSALESAAGGEGDVDDYCDDVLTADDDADEPKAGKPEKGSKPDKAHGTDNDDAGDVDNDDAGDSDNDDAGDVDNDDDGNEGGGRSSEHGKH